jgi:hypothetical protein
MLPGGDFTADAKEVGRELVWLVDMDAWGKTLERAGRDLARELDVDMVSRNAIGFELGVPGGVGGTRFGDCRRWAAEEDKESIVAGLKGVCIDFERADAGVL